MPLWCRLLPQSEMQLNLQQQSAITPKISVYAHVRGPHNFMHNPLAPLGFPLLAHENPDKRGSWADHAINACNLGTSMEHHRYFNMYSKHTRAEIIVDTLLFKHKYLTSPIVTPEDTVTEAAKRLTYAVNANYNSNKSVKMESLKQLVKVFKKIAEKTHKKWQTSNRKTIASKLTTKIHNQGWLSHNKGWKAPLRNNK